MKNWKFLLTIILIPILTYSCGNTRKFKEYYRITSIGTYILVYDQTEFRGIPLNSKIPDKLVPTAFSCDNDSTSGLIFCVYFNLEYYNYDPNARSSKFEGYKGSREKIISLDVFLDSTKLRKTEIYANDSLTNIFFNTNPNDPNAEGVVTPSYSCIDINDFIQQFNDSNMSGGEHHPVKHGSMFFLRVDKKFIANSKTMVTKLCLNNNVCLFDTVTVCSNSDQ